jgi:pimeloyl-ACP methyl ester carboxylesterase
MGWLTVVAAIAGALILAGIVYQWIGSVRCRRVFAAPGMLVDIGGRRLHCRCEGEGAPPVVLEAGIAASSLSWSIVQPAIAPFTRTCSYDRAGLAWSDPGTRTRSLASFAGELRLLLERVGIPPPYVLVGHSFGGLIVRAFAYHYPSEVAGLVFVDTLHPQEWLGVSDERRRMLRGGVFLSRVGGLLARLGVVRLCLALLTGGAPGAPRRFSRVFGPTAASLLEHIVGEVRKLPEEVLPAVQSHWSDPKAFAGMAQHLAALPSCSAEIATAGPPQFGDLPLIVLSAADRDATRIAADRALAQCSAAGRQITARQGAHWVQLDDVDLVVEAVREVVERARARS